MRLPSRGISTLIGSPKQLGVLLSFALLLPMILWIATHGLQLSEGRIVTGVPGTVSGDEPHYLIAVTSLLADGDLELQRDYRSALLGGSEAGRRWRRRPLAHHTILVDPATRAHALWLDACRWDRFDRCWPLNARRDHAKMNLEFPYAGTEIERSGHPVTSSILIAALVAPFGRETEGAEDRVAILMGLLTWLGVVATYRTARAIDLPLEWAWLASLLLGLASPWLAYSRSFYPATIAGLALVVALDAIVRQRFMRAALCVALAAAIKPAISLVGISWIASLAIQRRWDALARFGIVLGGCGLALGVFNFWLTGTPLVFGAITPEKIVNTDWAITDSLFHRNWGLLVFAPWAVAAFAYLTWIRPFSLRTEMQALQWVATALFPMTVLLSLFAAVGANCYGPRYWIPFLPWLAITAAMAFSARGPIIRSGIGILAVVSAAFAIPGALLYPNVWDSPPETALLELAQHMRE